VPYHRRKDLETLVKEAAGEEDIASGEDARFASTSKNSTNRSILDRTSRNGLGDRRLACLFRIL